MARCLNGEGVRDAILNQRKSATETAAYFVGNITKSVQDCTKGALPPESGRRVGIYWHFQSEYRFC